MTVVEQQGVTLIPQFIYISVWLGQAPGSAYSPETPANGSQLAGCSREKACVWWLVLITLREKTLESLQSCKTGESQRWLWFLGRNHRDGLKYY